MSWATACVDNGQMLFCGFCRCWWRERGGGYHLEYEPEWQNIGLVAWRARSTNWIATPLRNVKCLPYATGF